MTTIKEMAETAYPKMSRVSEPHGVIPADYESHNLGDANEEKREGFITGAKAVLEEIEKELQRRMLEDYNQGAEEDEVAQGCMASMIMFVRQLKK